MKPPLGVPEDPHFPPMRAVQPYNERWLAIIHADQDACPVRRPGHAVDPGRMRGRMPRSPLPALNRYEQLQIRAVGRDGDEHDHVIHGCREGQPLPVRRPSHRRGNRRCQSLKLRAVHPHGVHVRHMTVVRLRDEGQPLPVGRPLQRMLDHVREVGREVLNVRAIGSHREDVQIACPAMYCPATVGVGQIGDPRPVGRPGWEIVEIAVRRQSLGHLSGDRRAHDLKLIVRRLQQIAVPCRKARPRKFTAGIHHLCAVGRQAKGCRSPEKLAASGQRRDSARQLAVDDPMQAGAVNGHGKDIAKAPPIQSRPVRAPTDLAYVLPRTVTHTIRRPMHVNIDCGGRRRGCRGLSLIDSPLDRRLAVAAGEVEEKDEDGQVCRAQVLGNCLRPATGVRDGAVGGVAW